MTEQDEGVRALLDRVLTLFTDTGIAWALLRGRSELGTGRDVDLLVRDAHLRAAEEIVFGLGGAPLPQRRYPWHHMYVVDIPGPGPNLKLDIVTQLVYSRELMIASGLERGCLERRVSDGEGVLVWLSPTDTFWTILLHCALDKRWVAPDRADELSACVGALVRPSPAESFFASLCPPNWSPDRAVDAVVHRDWPSLGRLGSEVLHRLSAEGSPSRSPEPPSMRRSRRTLFDRVARRASDAATGAAYRQVWRALGLGLAPPFLDVVEEAHVNATMTALHRAPGRCDVELEIEPADLPRLLQLMEGRYRDFGGAWRRLGRRGLENVRLVPPRHIPAGHIGGAERSMLIPGRRHCRLAL